MTAGQTSEAQTEFRGALNEDVCPLRAVDEINQSIRSVASDLNVAVVDFESLLRDKCNRDLGHGCLGEEYFLDHVHPTIEVNRELALWIIESLKERRNRKPKQF